MNEYVSVAVLGRTRGNRGELTAASLGGDIDRLQQLERVFLYRPGPQPLDHAPYEVEEVWDHGGVPIFKFKGIDSISAAERLERAEVRVPAGERRQLEEGEFFLEDLVGCELIEQSGERAGIVETWHDYGGNILLETADGMLVPFKKAICLEIDPAAKRILVDLPPGLKDLNRNVG